MEKVNTQTTKHLLVYLYTSHKYSLLNMVHLSKGLLLMLLLDDGLLFVAV